MQFGFSSGKGHRAARVERDLPTAGETEPSLAGNLQSDNESYILHVLAAAAGGEAIFLLQLLSL